MTTIDELKRELLGRRCRNKEEEQVGKVSNIYRIKNVNVVTVSYYDDRVKVSVPIQDFRLSYFIVDA